MRPSKAQIKQIRSLGIKKFRTELGLFVAEGSKIVSELLPIYHCRWLVATAEWLTKQSNIQADHIYEVTQQELTAISLLKTPQNILAVFEQPATSTITPHITQLCLALDEVQDPGNLGTIVRIADWFGIHDIFCSRDCADIYNPKTVQATMGAMARVRLHYVDLEAFLQQIPANIPIYGTLLNGQNIYATDIAPNGIIVMGNEGNGISANIRKQITKPLFIPNFPIGATTSESLNVSVATAIVCAEFRRRLL